MRIRCALRSGHRSDVRARRARQCRGTRPGARLIATAAPIADSILMSSAWRRFPALAASATATTSMAAPDKPAARKERKEREAEPKAKRKEKDKEEVKERVTPAPKPVAPPAAAQPAPVVVQPPPAPVAVQPAPAQQLMTSFQTARALILSGKYEAGIAAMKALGYDDHPGCCELDRICQCQARKSDGGAELVQQGARRRSQSPPQLELFRRALPGAGRCREGARRPGPHQGDLRHLCREYQELDGQIAAKSR